MAVFGPALPLAMDIWPPVPEAEEERLHAVADVSSRLLGLGGATLRKPSEKMISNAVRIYESSNASNRIHYVNLLWHKRPHLASALRWRLERLRQLSRRREADASRRYHMAAIRRMGVQAGAAEAAISANGRLQAALAGGPAAANPFPIEDEPLAIEDEPAAAEGEMEEAVRAIGFEEPMGDVELLDSYNFLWADTESEDDGMQASSSPASSSAASASASSSAASPSASSSVASTSALLPVHGSLRRSSSFVWGRLCAFVGCFDLDPVGRAGAASTATSSTAAAAASPQPAAEDNE